MSFINRYLQDLETTAASLPKAYGGALQRRVRRGWLPPAETEVKINVDGGLSRSGNKGAAAAICRDCNETFLGASAVVFDGLSDPASLEAWACNEALALAQDLHVQRLLIASDCAEVITNMSRDIAAVYAPIMQEIDIRRRNFEHVVFRHEPRECISEAHSLAKAGSALDVGRHVWLGTVPDIICIPNCLNFE